MQLGILKSEVTRENSWLGVLFQLIGKGCGI